MDSDLLARAVTAGLELPQCPCLPCDSRAVCHHPRCPVCDGTGSDTSPWAIVGAVRISADYIEIARATVGVVAFDIDGAHRADVPHDGTPEGIRNAALLAFCRAREALP